VQNQKIRTIYTTIPPLWKRGKIFIQRKRAYVIVPAFTVAATFEIWEFEEI